MTRNLKADARPTTAPKQPIIQVNWLAIKNIFLTVYLPVKTKTQQTGWIVNDLFQWVSGFFTKPAEKPLKSNRPLFFIKPVVITFSGVFLAFYFGHDLLTEKEIFQLSPFVFIATLALFIWGWTSRREVTHLKKELSAALTIANYNIGVAKEAFRDSLAAAENKAAGLKNEAVKLHLLLEKKEEENHKNSKKAAKAEKSLALAEKKIEEMKNLLETAKKAIENEELKRHFAIQSIAIRTMIEKLTDEEVRSLLQIEFKNASTLQDLSNIREIAVESVESEVSEEISKIIPSDVDFCTKMCAAKNLVKRLPKNNKKEALQKALSTAKTVEDLDEITDKVIGLS